MSKRITLSLSILAGLFLAVAGVLFPMAVLPGGETTQATTQYLAQTQGVSLIYVAAVLLSNILILPVLALLSTRLFWKRPGTAVGANAILALAILLETVAVLASLARWTAIPAAAAGDPAANMVFAALQALFLAIDLPGALLFYAGGIVYAAGLWRLRRGTSLILAASTALFVAGLALMAISPAVSTILTAASIVVYGLAYVTLGRLAVALAR